MAYRVDYYLESSDRTITLETFNFRVSAENFVLEELDLLAMGFDDDDLGDTSSEILADVVRKKYSIVEV